jgi:hypothetical protein
MGTEDDSTYGGNGSFPNVKTLLDEREHNMNRLVKPPRIMYARCGLLIESCSHTMMSSLSEMTV